MKIGIIYHSLTGQTRKLANLLQTKLVQNGHEVSVVELKTDVEQKGGSIRQQLNFKVTNLPDLAGFDALCIGGPVWAFGPSTVTYKAIQQMPELNGKKVLTFATMGFPFMGWGGRQAIGHYSAALKQKGATILPGIIIPKLFHNFNHLMEKAANRSVELFS